jgi:lipopolysaccharide export system protein LptC
MDMTTLLIETFDEDGKPEMTINLPRSIMDLQTQIISTQSGVLIKRSDFELTGQNMEFNTDTRAGHLEGKVRMLIYNLDNETNPNPEDASAAK